MKKNKYKLKKNACFNLRVLRRHLTTEIIKSKLHLRNITHSSVHGSKLEGGASQGDCQYSIQDAWCQGAFNEDEKWINIWKE